MKLRIMLAAVCALAALGAVAGSASAAVPYGPFQMTAAPAGNAVTFELVPNEPITCKSSTVEGTHQAAAAGTPAWTVTSMKFLSCSFPPSLGAVTVTVPTPPHMLVSSTGGTTKVSFPDLKAGVKFHACEAFIGGGVTGEGPGNPTSSVAFTAKSGTLSVYSVPSSSCTSLFRDGQSTPFVINYSSSPIGL